MKFFLILLAAAFGNGLGAWNIRTIASNRLLLTSLLTFACVIIQQSALREVYTALTGKYILAWAIGSTIGITTATHLDAKYGKKK